MITQADRTTDITKLPDLAGPHGRAWRCDHLAGLVQDGVKAEDDAVLVSWCVEAAWAHPVWHSYWICLVHLRPMPDARETKVYLAGATHEFWLYALNPQEPRTQLVEAGKPAFLNPMNFAAQLVCADDAQALSSIETTVREIVNGQLSPDTDFRRAWIARFGDNMVRA